MDTMDEECFRTSSCWSYDDEQVCWICLEGPTVNNPLEKPCLCPRTCHLKCLSRWMLQSAGRYEERKCRFCAQELPDWKTVLTPPQLPPADPIMVVTLGDEVHRVRVKPGEEGQREFQKEIRRLFQIPDEVEFEVSFRCRAPCTSDTIQLEGMNSYDAATHCASLMAAQRMASGNANALPASPTLSSESRPHLQHQQSSVHASATPTGPHTFHEGCIPSSPLLHQDILQPETAPAHIPPSPDQYSSHAIMTGAQLAAALGGVLENSVPGLSAGLAPPSPYFRTAPMDHFASAF